MRVTINNFSGGIDAGASGDLVALKKSKMSYNFGFSSGALKSDVGFEAEFGAKPGESGLFDSLLSGESGFCGGCVFLYRRYDNEAEKEDNKLVIFDENYNGYYINLADESRELIPLGVKFSSRPEAIVYRLMGEDVLIMCSKGDNMVVWNGVAAPEIIADAPLITSMVIHYERLFATTIGDELTLKFSDDLDITNWSESLDDAGFIEMNDERGKLKKVISFNDYLYVFRERGITRVYANTADQRNFYVNHLFTAGGDILHKTIALCGDKIIFVASDGFYVFDGAGAYRRLDNLFPLIKVDDKSLARFYAGKYYLACKVDFKDDEYGDKDLEFNNAIVEIDAESLDYKIIRGVEVVDMLCFSEGEESKFLVLTTDESAPIKRLITIGASDAVDAGNKVVSKFMSGATNIISSKSKKVLRKVDVICYGGAEIAFINEKHEKIEVLALDDGFNEVGVFLPFELLSLEITTRSLGARVEEVSMLIR